MVQRTFRPGVYAPLPTFFDDNQEIDYVSYKNHLLSMNYANIAKILMFLANWFNRPGDEGHGCVVANGKWNKLGISADLVAVYSPCMCRLAWRGSPFGTYILWEKIRCSIIEPNQTKFLELWWEDSFNPIYQGDTRWSRSDINPNCRRSRWFEY